VITQLLGLEKNARDLDPLSRVRSTLTSPVYTMRNFEAPDEANDNEWLATTLILGTSVGWVRVLFFRGILVFGSSVFNHICTQIRAISLLRNLLTTKGQDT
jgi:hypothetical protein